MMISESDLERVFETVPELKEILLYAHTSQTPLSFLQLLLRYLADVQTEGYGTITIQVQAGKVQIVEKKITTLVKIEKVQTAIAQ